MLEPGFHLLEPNSKMCVADPSERKRWSKIGVRQLVRESGFSQNKILNGKPVCRYILSSFEQAAEKAARQVADQIHRCRPPLVLSLSITSALRFGHNILKTWKSLNVESAQYRLPAFSQ
jgi:hypothetical protein